jgi:N-acetylmuramoyl-L-alanine amidase
MFVADSPVVDRVVASPNHGERRGGAPDMLLLHYTGMQSADAALDKLCSAGSEVSTHYFVFEDGRTVQCVPEAGRAWHAGEATWAGQTDINSRSIGVEIANGGHDWGYEDFPEVQIAAVIALARDIVCRNAIPSHRVLGHSDVAPARKRDPGEKFPWARLAQAGVGLWVPPEPITDAAGLTIGDDGPPVDDLRARLARYGYGIAPTGTFDERAHEVVEAFQRHFRPERVDGIADVSTVSTLQRLLAIAP